MGEYRNVTTLEGIEVTGWEESSLPPERLILDAECAEPINSRKLCNWRSARSSI
jgi:hypothetical protein